MTIGIPCNPCTNGTCGNCVGVKLESSGFIRDAKDHCSCANNGHSNQKVRDMPNTTMLGSKKDTEPAHLKEAQGNFDDFGENE